MQSINHGDFEYKINQENKTAELFRKISDKNDILIPTYIEHEGIQYLVTKISNEAFQKCETIRSVQFSTDSKLLIIGRHAFDGSSLQSISIPPSVEQIQLCAFTNCQKLKQVNIPIDSKLQQISKSAFFLCSIEKIVIPSSVISIEESAFGNCKHLKEVHIPSDSKLKIIVRGAFCETIIESLIIPPSFQVFKSFSLDYCTKLKNIEIPLNTELKTIEKFAFNETSIESISIPTSIELKDGWCAGLKKLTKINLIPRNEKNIDYYNEKFIIGKTNKNQKNFNVLLFAPRDTKSFTFPSFITEIGPFSFSESSIRYLFIPDHITSICSSAFSECKELKRIEFAEKSQLKIIDDYLFQFSSIEQISIPSSVISIGCFKLKVNFYEISSNAKNCL